MQNIYIDLLTLSGEIVRVEVPSEHGEDVWEDIGNQMKIGGWWATGTYDGCSATFLGHRVERVNMKQIIATL